MGDDADFCTRSTATLTLTAFAQLRSRSTVPSGRPAMVWRPRSSRASLFCCSGLDMVVLATLVSCSPSRDVTPGGCASMIMHELCCAASEYDGASPKREELHGMLSVLFLLWNGRGL